MNVTWESVGVILSALGLAVLWMESRNKQRATETHEAIKISILENNEALIAKINGSYMRTDMANLKFDQGATHRAATDAKIAALEARIMMLETSD